MVFVSVLPRDQSATGYEFESAEFAIRPQNRAADRGLVYLRCLEKERMYAASELI